MWFEGSRLDSVRHECKREDDIRNWIWTEYDGSGYGKQRLTDVHNFLKLNMRFLKEEDDWMLEIAGSPLKNNKVQRNVTLIFYLGVDGNSSKIQTPSINAKTVSVFVFLYFREQKAPFSFHSILRTMEMVIYALSKTR